MSSYSPEFRKSVALAIFQSCADDAPPVDQLEALMGSKQPAFERNPLKYAGWCHEAMGRYCFAMAEQFLKGYEAQRVQWGKD